MSRVYPTVVVLLVTAVGLAGAFADGAVKQDEDGPYDGADDLALLDHIGEIAMAGGLSTDYRVSWGGDLEITVPSVLPSEARTIAYGICDGARQSTYAWSQPRLLRAYIIPSLDSPAAICKLSVNPEG